MTEYGQGPGPEPWRPEDPSYGNPGDPGYAGQQVPPGPDPYGGRPYRQAPDPYGQQAPHDPGGYAAPQDPLGQDPYGRPSPYPPQSETPAYDPWGTGAHQIPGHPHPGHSAHPGPAGHPEPSSPDPMGRPGQPTFQGPGAYPDQPQQPDPYAGQTGGWDTGAYGQPGYGAGDPYGGPAHGHHGHHGAGHGHGLPEGAGGPGAAGAPGGPAGAPGPGRPGGAGRTGEPEPDPPTDWDPGPDQGEHAFFAGGDEDDEDDEAGYGAGRRKRDERRGRAGKGRKQRSGCACLGASLALAAVVGGGGYFGYTFYQDHFGPPPDFSGEGTGATVTVEIPEGAGGYTMGRLLKEKGVVKSVDAFVKAQQDHPKGQMIQNGVYTLRKGMSGASAVELMLDPKSRNNLIIAEGRRNTWVYEQIDKRLELKAGTTKAVAKKNWKKLGLPSWARNHKDVKDPLEGFLYPSSYPVAKGMKPQDVLRRMVKTATQKYEGLDLAKEAKRLHLDGPWQLVTVASLVQAEGKTHEDFRKMAEVIYNRLKPDNTQTNQYLQFDSSFNYLKNESRIDIGEAEINSNHDPYNTYTRKGLTPGPIGNPGAEALRAALHPTQDGWIYFVATDGMEKTEFAKTYSAFQQLKAKFNEKGGA